MFLTFLLVFDGLQKLLCSQNNFGVAEERFDFSPEDKQCIRAYKGPKDVLQERIFETAFIFEILQSI